MKVFMSLISLIIILLVLAGIGWLVNTKFGGINPTIRWLINAVLIVIAIIFVLAAFGIWDTVKSIQVPKI